MLALTGEGRYDATSADGKITGAVLAAAAGPGPGGLAAGSVAADPPPGVVAVAWTGWPGSRRGHAGPSGWLRARSASAGCERK